MNSTSGCLQTIRNLGLIRLRSKSLLLQLTFNLTIISTIELLGVNFWMMRSMRTSMYQPAIATHPQPMEALWTVGLHNLMSATLIAVPLLVGAIAVTVWLALQPLRQFNHFVTTHPLEALTQTTGTLGHLPSEVRGLAQTYTQLATTFADMGVQQRQFINNISHELRTPLSLVYGYLQQTLRRNANLTAMQQEALETAAAETERTVRLLQDLLDLARAENHCLPVHLERLVLNEVVAEAVQMTEKFKHRMIQVEAPAEALVVKADRERLMQVLIHLLDNAIQHSDAVHPVTLSLAQTTSWVTIQVSDQGCGIALPEQALIFHPFYRVDPSRTRATGGAGLGLAIVDILVKRMGGRVSVQSEPDKGSIFQVLLPTR